MKVMKDMQLHFNTILYMFEIKFLLPTDDLIQYSWNKEACAMQMVWWFAIIPTKQSSYDWFIFSYTQEDTAEKFSLTTLIKFKVRKVSVLRKNTVFVGYTISLM